VSAFYFVQEGDDLKLADKLSKEVKTKLNQIQSPKNKDKNKDKKKPKLKPKKEEKINWHDIMDSNKRGLRRGKGGAWK
jgi:hypothetical protein